MVFGAMTSETFDVSNVFCFHGNKDDDACND